MTATLVADIGGTHARFGLVRNGAVGRVEVVATADHPGFAAAAAAYLDRVCVGSGARPRAGAIAVAGPVGGDRVRLTNHPWSFPVAGTAAALGLARLEVINDFAAVALAVPRLGAGDLRSVGGGGPAVAGAPVAVIGPGTGLGVSSVIADRDGWLAVPGEGGHVTLAGTCADEDRVIARLRDRFGHASGERAVSGPGLVNLYEALAGTPPPPPGTPAAVTDAAAVGKDPAAATAVTMFCGFLGTLAGNLALTIGAAGGVYIAGGIVPKLGGLFDRSPFRARFVAKGRFSGYLDTIPCWVITQPLAALVGLGGLLDGRGRVAGAPDSLSDPAAGARG